MPNTDKSPLEIREAKSRKEQKDFLGFPQKLYRGCPYFVPPLYSDEKRIFRSDYFYYDQSEAIYLNAYQDGRMVGRISGILQKSANEKWKQKRVRFTRFDCLDDQKIADALFAGVEKWAVSKGMEEIVGPLGFSDMEREGLLVDGFDQLSTFEEAYNYPYYEKLLLNRGYVKEAEWNERMLFAPKKADPRIKKISEAMMKRTKCHFAQPKNTKDLLNTYGQQFFDIVEETYKDIYQTVPFTAAEIADMIKGFRLILDKKYLAIILNEENKVVAFGLCFPSIAKAVQKSGGHLTLGCLFRLLKAIKHPRVIDMGLIGVRPEYKNTGIDWAILSRSVDMLSSGIDYAETNLNLVDNLAIQNTWNHFDYKIHKLRRSYVKKLS
jgi:hypothetical protein